MRKKGIVVDRTYRRFGLDFSEIGIYILFMENIKPNGASTGKRQVLVSFDIGTYERVRQFATQEDRPMSTAVRRLVIEALDAKDCHEKANDL